MEAKSLTRLFINKIPYFTSYFSCFTCLLVPYINALSLTRLFINKIPYFTRSFIPSFTSLLVPYIDVLAYLCILGYCGYIVPYTDNYQHICACEDIVDKMYHILRSISVLVYLSILWI